MGDSALYSNTQGSRNTAIGNPALLNNTDGNDNTAIGAFALFSNTGDYNTATGVKALSSNIAGIVNTATGYAALASNTDGNSNTATGVEALSGTTSGGFNTANGYQALLSNDTGDSNTAQGVFALGNVTTGSNNTGLGRSAGTSVTTADHVICIGANVSGANASNTTWIGNVFGTTTLSGTTAPVIVSITGQLGTMSSSRRFKKEIKPMDKASESVLALKPVTFQYKSDTKGTPQFGLIAEEVAKANPDLIVRDGRQDLQRPLRCGERDVAQ